MPVNIGILGVGFMGINHFAQYQRIKGVRVTALCDVDPKKLRGDWASVTGNIGGPAAKPNLKGVNVYADARALLKDKAIHVVDITLPTYLHARWAIAAMKAGKHVICEKPMAINSHQAGQMVAQSRRTGRRLYIAHCIRFWPLYAMARRIMRGGKFGRVISASFRRLGSTPMWSWQGWLQRPALSGLCPLDLHIHDADFVLYCFGKPKAVTSHGTGLSPGRLDHILSVYDYGRGKLVTAEGGWEFAPEYPFGMTFTIHMEKATLASAPDLTLTLYPKRGGAKRLKVPPGNGYSVELAHFISCLRSNRLSPIVPPRSALQSVKLIEHEIRSVNTGRRVAVRL